MHREIKCYVVPENGVVYPLLVERVSEPVTLNGKIMGRVNERSSRREFSFVRLIFTSRPDVVAVGLDPRDSRIEVNLGYQIPHHPSTTPRMVGSLVMSGGHVY